MKAYYDVIVAGGGPAGATAARRLAEAGRSVLLVQRDLHYDKPCGGALLLSAFDEFGLDKNVVFKTVDRLDLTAPGGYATEVPLAYAPLAVAERPVFDAHLRDLAVRAGAELVEGKCKSIENGRAVIVTERGENSVGAAYFIAADGVNSALRRQLTGELPRRVLALYAKVPELAVEGCGFRFGKDVAPGHYAWAFTHRGGAHIGVIADDEKTIHGHFETFCRQLGLKTPPKAKGFYIPRWKDDCYVHGNVLFAGDAAGQVSPFTYEGIYYAMRSGAYAAEAIIQNDPALYERLWRESLRKRFRAMDMLQRLLLRWDWTAEKIVRLQENPNVRSAALRFWSGRSVPSSGWKAFGRGIKLLAASSKRPRGEV